MERFQREPERWEFLILVYSTRSPFAWERSSELKAAVADATGILVESSGQSTRGSIDPG